MNKRNTKKEYERKMVEVICNEEMIDIVIEILDLHFPGQEFEADVVEEGLLRQVIITYYDFCIEVDIYVLLTKVCAKYGFSLDVERFMTDETKQLILKEIGNETVGTKLNDMIREVFRTTSYQE